MSVETTLASGGVPVVDPTVDPSDAYPAQVHVFKRLLRNPIGVVPA